MIHGQKNIKLIIMLVIQSRQISELFPAK